MTAPEQSHVSEVLPVLQTSSTRIPGTVIPPPLVRGGQQASSKLGTQQNTQIVMPPLVRGAQVSVYLVLEPSSCSLRCLHCVPGHLSAWLEGTWEVLVDLSSYGWWMVTERVCTAPACVVYCPIRLPVKHEKIPQ